MIPLKRWPASAYIQLRHSSCNLGYLSRIAAFLPTVRAGAHPLSRQLSLITLSEACANFDMLKNLVGWVREAVFEV